MDRWIKCISTPGNIRGVSVQATELIQSMIRMHSLKGEAAQGLGEAVLAALLLASYSKVGERINLNVQGSGHYQQALVDAYPDGTVRGYLIERDPSSVDHRVFDQYGPWGSGVLSVLRTKNKEGAPPYIGTVPLVTGHLAKDLTFYWLQSEQVPSAVGLAVSLNAEGDVTAAGGFLVQALPGADAGEIKAIEKQLNELHSLAKQLSDNGDPVHLLSRIFENTAFILLEETPLKFQCNCSLQKIERTLLLLPMDDLEAMIKEGHAAVRCDFCSKQYQIDAEELRSLIQKRQ